MKPIFLILTSLFLSCATQKPNSQNGYLEGTTGLFEGNCMPSPDKPPCEAKPISTLVYITQPSEAFDQDLLVTSVLSSEDGQFSVDLAPGKYSIFLQDGEEKICSGINCEGADCYCTLIIIEKDSTTTVSANIDHASW